MSKLRVFCMTLVAMFAFGAVAASASFAEGPEWLVEEKALTAETPAETVGTVLLVRWASSALTVVLNEVECTGIFFGKIGPGGADLIEKLYNSASEETTALGGLSLLCPVKQSNKELTDCKLGSEVLLWADNLPYVTQLELMEVEGKEDILDKFTGTGGEPGWDIECLSESGLTGSELCEALPGTASTLLENEPLGSPASVLGWFLPEAMTELGTCGTSTEVAEIVSDVSADTWAVTALLGIRLATSISGG